MLAITLLFVKTYKDSDLKSVTYYEIGVAAPHTLDRKPEADDR